MALSRTQYGKNGTVDSRYLESQGTLWTASRYPYLEISELQKWGIHEIEQPHLTKEYVIWLLKLEIYISRDIIGSIRQFSETQNNLRTSIFDVTWVEYKVKRVTFREGLGLSVDGKVIRKAVQIHGSYITLVRYNWNNVERVVKRENHPVHQNNHYNWRRPKRKRPLDICILVRRRSACKSAQSAKGLLLSLIKCLKPIYSINDQFRLWSDYSHMPKHGFLFERALSCNRKCASVSENVVLTLFPLMAIFAKS